MPRPPLPSVLPLPTINGEGTETLCAAFLYKKRKITTTKTKRFKRAFPFVLRGIAVFECVNRIVERFNNLQHFTILHSYK